MPPLARCEPASFGTSLSKMVTVEHAESAQKLLARRPPPISNHRENRIDLLQRPPSSAVAGEMDRLELRLDAAGVSLKGRANRPQAAFIKASTISSTTLSTRSRSSPSPITRITGSVPDGPL